jgi:biotin carboxyl carrier protein
MKYIAEVDGLEFPLEILDDHHVRFGENVLEVDLDAIGGEPLYSLIVNGESYEGYVYQDENGWQVLLQGQFYQIRVVDEREKRLKMADQGIARPGAESVIKAPMPGLVIALLVTEGQDVTKGQILVILESMKMQNELRAPSAGKVTRLRIKQGESVEQRQVLLTLISALPAP